MEAKTKHTFYAPNGYCFVKSISHRSTDKIKREKIPYISLYSLFWSASAGTSMLLVKKADYEKIKNIKGVGKCVEKLSHEGEWFSRRENDKIDTEFRKANPKYHYGLGGALIFLGLGVAGVMAYNSSKNQAPEGEYKVKLYKKGTLQDTIIFSESYVDKATQDFKKLGYVVRVAKIKTMAEGGNIAVENAQIGKTYWKKNHKNKWTEYVFRGKDDSGNFLLETTETLYGIPKGSDYVLGKTFLYFNEPKHIKNSVYHLAKGGGVGDEVYIEFLNKDKGFKKDVKHFKSYEEAVKWGRENFDNFNSDMIHYKMAKGGGVVTYKNKYNTKYGYDKNESHSLEDIARDTKISLKGLQQIYDKGIGAYKTNPQSVRPNVKSKEQWAMARVYSAVMGGKASKVDENELKMAKGGGVKTEFDKSMVLNNLDMIKEYSVAIDKIVTENTKLDEWVKMKLTKVEQNMADIKHAIEGFNKYGQGGQIFKKQLLHISKYATDIKKMVSGDAEVMSWIEGKLFVSADYMDTLYHFLDYESGNTASKYKAGGKVGAEYVVYDWDTYNKLSTHKTIESAKKRMYELYKEKKNLHLAVKNLSEFEQTKEMLQMKDGGSIEESSKVGLHLPMEISVYVPSTKDANVPVSKAELSARVKEVKQYLATLFGGYSSSEIIGGYVSTTGELIQEDVVKVISFATKQAYEDNEATLIDKIADWSKEWSQEAIGLEIEGDLYYINQTQETFRVGGSVGGFEYTIGGL